MRLQKKDWHLIKIALTIVFLSCLIIVAIVKIEGLMQILGTIIGIIAPFLIALFVAFLVNMPMSLIENHLLKHLPLGEKGKRAISLIAAYLIVFAFFFFLLGTVIPQFINSFRALLINIPPFLERATEYINNIDLIEPLDEFVNELLSQAQIDNIRQKAIQWITTDSAETVDMVLSGLVGTLGNVVSGIVDLFLIFVFSIYILFSKETLARQAKELIYSFAGEKTGDFFMYLSYTAYDNFYNFFTGQFLEAIALGFMNFVGMTLLGMPYAIVVSIIIGFGALIPMVGAILAGIFGFFLLLIESPIMAVGFVVFIIVLQQVEGNLVYPRIVGKSVGLPSIWVLLAITVGGSAFGILGMLLFVPLFSTLYDLLTDFKTKRLVEKDINIAEK